MQRIAKAFAERCDRPDVQVIVVVVGEHDRMDGWEAGVVGVKGGGGDAFWAYELHRGGAGGKDGVGEDGKRAHLHEQRGMTDPGAPDGALWWWGVEGVPVDVEHGKRGGKVSGGGLGGATQVAGAGEAAGALVTVPAPHVSQGAVFKGWPGVAIAAGGRVDVVWGRI